VDPGQLQQVFVNLIVNAEQAMKKAHGKGTLTVTTEKHEIISAYRSVMMAPVFQKKIWAACSSRSTRRKSPVRHRSGVEFVTLNYLEHNGRMTVESEPGRGAMFIIDLPVYNTLPPEGGARGIRVRRKSSAKEAIENFGRRR